MGRREDRAALEATWTVYEPSAPGRPMTRADRDVAMAPDEAVNHRERLLAEGNRRLRGLARRQRLGGGS